MKFYRMQRRTVSFQTNDANAFVLKTLSPVTVVTTRRGRSKVTKKSLEASSKSSTATSIMHSLQESMYPVSSGIYRLSLLFLSNIDLLDWCSQRSFLPLTFLSRKTERESGWCCRCCLKAWNTSKEEEHKWQSDTACQSQEMKKEEEEEGQQQE